MNLSQVLSIYGGGPGSGCHGPNCGRPTGGQSMGKHLLNVSKLGKLPNAVAKGNDLLYKAGMDKRYLTMKPISKFSVHDKLSIHPLAVANYVEAHQQLQMRKDADANDYIHEMGHHIDIAYTRAGGEGINEEKAQKIIADYTEEYKAARDKLTDALGHKYNFTNDNAKVTPTMMRGLPTAFAADSSKEWWAESFFLYARGGASRERLASIAPKTTAAIRSVLRGDIFAANDVDAGGPGSGCRGDNCGRKSLGQQKQFQKLQDLHDDIQNGEWTDRITSDSTKYIFIFSMQRKMLSNLSDGLDAHIKQIKFRDPDDPDSSAKNPHPIVDKLMSQGKGSLDKASELARKGEYQYATIEQDNALSRFHDVLFRLSGEDIEAYGTSEGLQKAWDTRGRGKKKLSDLAQRALVSYKPVSPETRRTAAASEIAVAKAIGGEAKGDNKPFDVIKGNVYVEVKTMTTASENRINMKTRSRIKKEAYVKKNGGRAYTVAIDMRGGKAIVYYKKGVGAFTLASMERLSNIKELRSVLK